MAAPKINIGEAASTALALVIHELATNSAKYGALSVPSGLLDVSCADGDGEVVIVWTERGGPPVVAPDKPPGYGSRMISRSLSAQLGGTIAMKWSREGAIATLRLNNSRLHVQSFEARDTNRQQGFVARARLFSAKPRFGREHEIYRLPQPAVPQRAGPA